MNGEGGGVTHMRDEELGWLLGVSHELHHADLQGVGDRLDYMGVEVVERDLPDRHL